MPLFLDTTGEATLGIAICRRCQIKRKLADLVDDGNIPGFKVCRPLISPGCWDNYDPMRLPPRPPDKYNLPYVAPDVPLLVSRADEDQLPLQPPMP